VRARGQMSKALLTFYAHTFLGDPEEVTVEALFECKLGPRGSIRAVDLARRMGPDIAPDDVRAALQSLRAHGLVRQIALSRRVRDEPGWRLREDWPTLLEELMGRIRRLHEAVVEDMWSCACRDGKMRRTFSDCIAFCRRRGARGAAFTCPHCHHDLVLCPGSVLSVGERREDNEALGTLWRLREDGDGI
jgi:hypothetical protein